jgi:TRAP-type C4-dicarboxylate transport system permease small subunit
MTSLLAEVTLTGMMLLTVSDVILRSFGRPILGTYEVVAFLGAVAVGFSVPITSWMRGQVRVDLLISNLSRRNRNILNVLTRCLVIAFFLLLSWRLIAYGMHLQQAKEVSITLRMPFYPIAYGLALAFVVQSFVLFCDILKIRGGSYD